MNEISLSILSPKGVQSCDCSFERLKLALPSHNLSKYSGCIVPCGAKGVKRARRCRCPNPLWSLEFGFQSPAKYIGMLGSNKKYKALLELLEKEGIDPSKFDRVSVPVGLDIGFEASSARRGFI